MELMLTLVLVLQVEWKDEHVSRRQQKVSVGLMIREGSDAEADHESPLLVAVRSFSWRKLEMS